MKHNILSLKKIIFSSALAITSLFLTSCYSWYDEKIPMDTKTQKINLSDLLYAEKPVTALEAPAQLIVSQGKYGGVIKLHWNEVPHATSYRLERAVIIPDPSTGICSVPEEGDFEVLSKYVYSCNYTDLILASPGYSNNEYSNRYYYRVCAENIQKGYESSEFTQISEETCGWLLPPPASIEAAKGDNPDYIEVTWNPVSGANRYYIYRGEKENGLGMEFVESVMGNITSYKNTLSSSEKGIEFYYKVCAVLSDGSQSAFTGLALGYSAKEGVPVPPNNITVTNGKGVSKKSLDITWDKVEKSGYSITYSVYRSSSTDSIYSLVKNHITTESVTDDSLKTGVKYYYYVQVIATNESDPTDILKSQFSKITEETEGWLLSPPGNCEIEESSTAGKNNLRWTPAIGFDAKNVNYTYNIYGCDTIDGEYTLINQDVQPGSETLVLGDDGYYNFLVDEKAFYKVSTVNDIAALESELGVTVAPCPKAPVNVTASKTSALDGLDKYEANTNGVYPVKVSWSAPAGDNPYGYYVYRSAKPDSSFRKITDEPITDALEFIDNNETARAGSYYYYKVVSVNMLRQGKNCNEHNENSKGYGALTRDQWFREYNKTVKKSQSRLTLMHKGGTSALGSESANGGISGKLSYKAEMAGLGARITMHYTDYAEFYIGGEESGGVYFLLNGDTNTTANMSANGSMDGTNRAHKDGMYPGYAKYDKLEIKGGGAGGGYYIVCTMDKNENTVLAEGNVDWVIGEE